MSAAGNILDLRRLLAERFPTAVAPRSTGLPTGVPILDQRLGGGIARQTLTELVRAESAPSAGSALLIGALIQGSAHSGRLIALIDGADSFDPQPLDNRELAHLIWVRCRQASQAVRCADLLLRDGNIAFVILDLALNAAHKLQKIPSTAWFRLQRAAEAGNAACLAITPCAIVSAAQRRLQFSRTFSLDDLDEAPAATLKRLHWETLRDRAWAGAPLEAVG